MIPWPALVRTSTAGNTYPKRPSRVALDLTAASPRTWLGVTLYHPRPSLSSRPVSILRVATAMTRSAKTPGRLALMFAPRGEKKQKAKGPPVLGTTRTSQSLG